LYGDSDLTEPMGQDHEAEEPDKESSSMEATISGEPDEPHSFRGSFLLFMWEQTPQWRWYSLMTLGALGAGGRLFSFELKTKDIWSIL